ncbi:MAG: hypothetical protein JRH16_09445, partial [Deltaproteobacteria bacterium]|nr:hypothetical protein [Deltaproteobacteria bacterium]
GLNDFNVYRADEERLPKRYPVFVRRDSGHGKPLSGLLEDRDSVARAIEAAIEEGVPAANLLIVEYAAEPVIPGVFRKLAVARIGDRLVPQPSVHDDQWLVKFGSKAVATEELYQEESRLLEELPHAKELWRAFEIASIGYGRADFGFFFNDTATTEIYTNPTVKPGKDHPSKTRQANLRHAWNAHLAALRELDSKFEGAGFVALGH